jgi:hypothetical protein
MDLTFDTKIGVLKEKDLVNSSNEFIWDLNAQAKYALKDDSQQAKVLLYLSLNFVL